MIHYWLTDIDGSQYINNPGGPDHGSKSIDGGVTWDRPRNVNTLTQREERMAEIMMMAERNREAERKRLADQQDETLANHFGNMETPETAAERERERREQNLKAMKELKKLVDRKTIGEHMMNVLGCALFAVCIAGGATVVVACIDAILKTVRAW